jgi:hypothetical protein
MNPHAGRSNDERVAAHTRKKLPSLEQPGGPMAVEGSESDITHSSGQLSEAGKEVWRTGAGMDGGGKSAPGHRGPIDTIRSNKRTRVRVQLQQHHTSDHTRRPHDHRRRWSSDREGQGNHA